MQLAPEQDYFLASQSVQHYLCPNNSRITITKLHNSNEHIIICMARHKETKF